MNHDASKFYGYIENTNQDVIVKVCQIRCNCLSISQQFSYHVTDKGFNMLLDFLRELVPK